jgi:hypothetical protein
MMLAAFRAARFDDNTLKPRELTIGQQCLAWGTLPRNGGYLDQPVRLMNRMTVLLNIYNSTKAWVLSNDWADFARRHPDDWKLVQDLIMLEEEHGSKL